MKVREVADWELGDVEDGEQERLSEVRMGGTG